MTNTPASQRNGRAVTAALVIGKLSVLFLAPIILGGTALAQDGGMFQNLPPGQARFFRCRTFPFYGDLPYEGWDARLCRWVLTDDQGQWEELTPVVGNGDPKITLRFMLFTAPTQREGKPAKGPSTWLRTEPVVVVRRGGATRPEYQASLYVGQTATSPGKELLPADFQSAEDVAFRNEISANIGVWQWDVTAVSGDVMDGSLSHNIVVATGSTSATFRLSRMVMMFPAISGTPGQIPQWSTYFWLRPYATGRRECHPCSLPVQMPSRWIVLSLPIKGLVREDDIYKAHLASGAPFDGNVLLSTLREKKLDVTVTRAPGDGSQLDTPRTYPLEFWFRRTGAAPNETTLWPGPVNVPVLLDLPVTSLFPVTGLGSLLLPLELTKPNPTWRVCLRYAAPVAEPNPRSPRLLLAVPATAPGGVRRGIQHYLLRNSLDISVFCSNVQRYDWATPVNLDMARLCTLTCGQMDASEAEKLLPADGPAVPVSWDSLMAWAKATAAPPEPMDMPSDPVSIVVFLGGRPAGPPPPNPLLVADALEGLVAYRFVVADGVQEIKATLRTADSVTVQAPPTDLDGTVAVLLPDRVRTSPFFAKLNVSQIDGSQLAAVLDAVRESAFNAAAGQDSVVLGQRGDTCLRFELPSVEKWEIGAVKVQLWPPGQDNDPWMEWEGSALTDEHADGEDDRLDQTAERPARGRRFSVVLKQRTTLELPYVRPLDRAWFMTSVHALSVRVSVSRADEKHLQTSVSWKVQFANGPQHSGFRFASWEWYLLLVVGVVAMVARWAVRSLGGYGPVLVVRGSDQWSMDETAFATHPDCRRDHGRHKWLLDGGSIAAKRSGPLPGERYFFWRPEGRKWTYSPDSATDELVVQGKQKGAPDETIKFRINGARDGVEPSDGESGRLVARGDVWPAVLGVHDYLPKVGVVCWYLVLYVFTALFFGLLFDVVGRTWFLPGLSAFSSWLPVAGIGVGGLLVVLVVPWYKYAGRAWAGRLSPGGLGVRLLGALRLGWAILIIVSVLNTPGAWTNVIAGLCVSTLTPLLAQLSPLGTSKTAAAGMRPTASHGAPGAAAGESAGAKTVNN